MEPKLDPETLRWAAKYIEERMESHRSVGSRNAAALAGMDEAAIMLSAAASRLSRGEPARPQTVVDDY